MSRTSGREQTPEPDSPHPGDPSHSLLDHTSEGWQIISPEFRYVYLNEAAVAHGRTTRDQLLGRTMMEIYPGIEDTEMFSVLRRCMDERCPQCLENEFTFPDGSKGWFELRFESVPGGVAILSLDINDRKHAEARVAHLNALLRGIRDVNQLIVRERDPRTLIQRACRILVESSGFETCCIVVCDDDQVKLVADAGEPLRLHALRRMLAAEEVPECVERVLRGTDLVVRRAPTTTCAGCPASTDYPDDRGAVAVRLESGGSVLGAMLVSLAADLAGDGEEIALIREVAGDVAFALKSIETEAERSRAIEAVRESATRWRATFDAITDIVCVLSVDHELIDINAAGCAALGKPREEIVGQRCFELVHGTTAPIPGCPCAAVARALEPATSEHEQDGRRYELSAWPILGTGRRLEGLVHVVKDTTDRRRAEEGLKLFRKLVDQSSDTIEVLDPDTGRFLEVNERGCLDHGYSREEYCALTVFDLDPKVDAATFRAVMGQVRESGSLTWDGVHRRKDGSTFPVEVKLKLVQLDRPYLVATVRDVTERREAEEAIRRGSDAQGVIASILRRSLDDLPLEELLPEALRDVLSIPWLSPEGKGAIFLVEDESETLVLQASEGLTSTHLDRCASTSFGDCLCGQAASRSELVYAGDLDERHTHTCGGMVPHGHYSVPLVYKDQVIGVFTVLLAAGHPYTQAEADFLTDVANTLAGIVVRSRTEEQRARAEEQLNKVQRLEAVGRLAGGVAHDFNNLLSVIITYAGFALEDLRRTDPMRADLEEVQRAGQRAAELTRQLLAFSRKQVLEPEVLDLNEVVGGIEAMLRRLLGEDIDIVVHTADGLGRVEADPGQIEQVIMNLAVNARDAMPSGGKLTIETANVELDQDYANGRVGVKPGRYVQLVVSDTGCGMDDQTLARVFEPFFTTKGQDRGTGLGLATVYGIVKQSGGNIWVYSEPDRGTSFKVYLPRVDAPATAAKRPTAPQVAAGDETVLVVEDEVAVRRAAERILSRAGYQVLAAANGGEALLLCERHDGTIDLLLTDVVMPQMSGRELAERLAEIRPGLRTLYMSGYTDNAIVHHGVLDPGTRFISKPFSVADLTRKVREVLDEEPEGEGPAPQATNGRPERSREE